MLHKRRIRALEALNEIRRGTTETELRVRFRLSSKGIERLFNLLVTKGSIDQSELFEKCPWYEQKFTQADRRWEPRVSLKGRVYIYDVLRSSTGTLRDISEKGFRVAGIRCKIGESKSLLLDLQPLMMADPILVVAKCRWKETRGHKRKYITAGFEILDISETDSKVIKSLIESLRTRAPGTGGVPQALENSILRSDKAPRN
jgi:hypothetical protein